MNFSISLRPLRALARPLALCLLLCAGRAGAQQADDNNLLRLAQTYEQAGQYETALRYYKDLFLRRPNNPAYFDGLRRMLAQLKKYPELVDILDKRIGETPQDPLLRAYLGSALFRMGKETEAAEAWEAAVRINPANTGAYRFVAEQALDNKQYKTAVDFLLRGRKAGNNELLFVNELARAYALQLQFDRAMEEYIRLLLNNPSSIAEVQRQILQFSTLPEGMAAALDAVKEATGDHPDDSTLRYLHAWLLMEKKDYASALRVYEEIDKRRPSEGAELLNFARRAFSEQAYGVAMQAFGEVAERYPGGRNEPEALYYRVRSIEALNDERDSVDTPAALRPKTLYPTSEAVPSYAGAVTLYEEVVNKYPNHPVGLEAKYRIGLIKFNRFGDTDGALAILEPSADMRRQISGNQDANILIGDIYTAQGKLDKARAQYDRVLGLEPLTPVQKNAVAFRIAELSYFLGQFDDALKRLAPLAENSDADIANDALELSMFILENRKSGDGPLAEYAKAALLERQKKYAEAAAILSSMIQRFASEPIVDRCFITLASLQRRSGQYEAARKTLADFLAGQPESILRDRGEFDLAELTFEEFHDSARAVELYEQLLRDFPNSLLAGRARQRIRSLRQSNP